MISVYYDGKCGLCRREIEHYQSIAPEGRFIWHDIATNPEPLERLGMSQAAALELLHAEDDTGQLQIGVDAFIAIWRGIDAGIWKLLAIIISLPIIRPLAKKAYRWFAARRFAKLEHCQIASSNTD